MQETQDMQSQIDAAQLENQQLSTNYAELEEKFAQAETDAVLNRKTNQVLNAQILANNGLYQEAVDSVASIDPSGLPSDIADQISSIRSISYPMLVQKYLQDGTQLYNQGLFEEARQQCENAVRYITPEDPEGDDALYRLGQAAQQLGLTDLARQSFQRILDEFPSGNQARNAQTRLNQLG
jgi:TolA-binding protein